MDDKFDEWFLHGGAVGGVWGKEHCQAVYREETPNLSHLYHLSGEVKALEARHAIVPHPTQQLLYIGVGHKLSWRRDE